MQCLQVTEFDKQFSAYMLFYERADELEPIDQLRRVSQPAAGTSAMASAVTSAPASASESVPGAEPAAEAAASAAESTVPPEPIFTRLVDVSPALMLQMPSKDTAMNSIQQLQRIFLA